MLELDANKSLFKIAYKIGEMHTRNRLTLEDMIELISKLDYHNTVWKMICECKNKLSLTGRIAYNMVKKTLGTL